MVVSLGMRSSISHHTLHIAISVTFVALCEPSAHDYDCTSDELKEAGIELVDRSGVVGGWTFLSLDTTAHWVGPYATQYK